MTQFEALQVEHEALLIQQDQEDPNPDLLNDVERFIQSVIAHSGEITDPRERDQLRAYLRYWSSFVYDQTGVYPKTELRPAEISRGSTGFKSYQWAILAAFTVAVTLLIGIGVQTLIQPASMLYPTITPTGEILATETKQPSLTATVSLTPISVTDCLEPAHPLSTGSLINVTARIMVPDNCSEIVLRPDSSTAAIGGVFSGSLEGLELWVLIYPHKDKLFYPQAIDACKNQITEINQDKGLWSTAGHFGRPAKKDYFDIVATAVEAESDTSRLLDEWIREVCENPRKKGISPKDLLESAGLLRELDTVVVRSQ